MLPSCWITICDALTSAIPERYDKCTYLYFWIFHLQGNEKYFLLRSSLTCAQLEFSSVIVFLASSRTLLWELNHRVSMCPSVARLHCLKTTQTVITKSLLSAEEKNPGLIGYDYSRNSTGCINSKGNCDTRTQPMSLRKTVQVRKFHGLVFPLSLVYCSLAIFSYYPVCPVCFYGLLPDSNKWLIDWLIDWKRCCWSLTESRRPILVSYYAIVIVFFYFLNSVLFCSIIVHLEWHWTAGALYTQIAALIIIPTLAFQVLTL